MTIHPITYLIYITLIFTHFPYFVVIASVGCSFDELSAEFSCLFSPTFNEVHKTLTPSAEDRKAFFKPVFLQLTRRPPKNKALKEGTRLYNISQLSTFSCVNRLIVLTISRQ